MQHSPTEAYRIYMASPQWRRLRQAKFAEVGRRCERCGGRECIEVHHRSYQNFGRERLEELEVLCRPCHAGEHGEDWDDALPVAGIRDAEFAARAHLERKQQAELALLAGLEVVDVEVASMLTCSDELDKLALRDLRWLQKRSKKMRRSLGQAAAA
jgi:hypothetical protein